jgi:epoxyqueuosine reductase
LEDEPVQSFTEQVKAFAHTRGAQLFGVAPVDRFAQAPQGHRPEDILPPAKSVVVCATRLPEGALAGPATSYQQVMNAQSAQLDQIAYEVALFLERDGGFAVPVPSEVPYRHWEPDNQYGRGDLSHTHAAQAAGLGRIGKNSLLITPQFGNRVHLVSIVTDVELAADEMLQEELCPQGCSRCIDACPAGAIRADTPFSQKLCRGTMLEKLPKGTVIENCRECRKACLVGTRRKA